MFRKLTKLELLIGLGSTILLVVATIQHNMLTCGSSAACLCLIVGRLLERNRSAAATPDVGDFASDESESTPLPRKLEPRQRLAYEAATQSAPELIRNVLQNGRETLLLRSEIIGNLNEAQVNEIVDVVCEDMSLVPAGKVALSINDLAGSEKSKMEEVATLLVDRYAVNNAEYAEFVAAGGYADQELWDADVFDAMAAFVDQSEQPGPRYWRDGTFPRGKADHPVVGICWYEARAYARWVGKRLPTGAEWVKTAGWPVAASGDAVRQRTYPWGNSYEPGRANISQEGIGHTATVDDFADGDNVRGVRQLAGNVWEWTDDELTFAGSAVDSSVQLGLKSLRGGAFNTYLEGQASCDFESGDHVLSRRDNVGFRCAVSMTDLSEAVHEQLVAALGA